MNAFSAIKIKNIQLSFIILASLVILSLAFYVSAENNSISANNIFADSDQDGLSDQEEKIYGTDPHEKDTDNDGYTDGIEVQSGYDPTKPAPGDKIIPEKKTGGKNNSGADQENLTKKLAYEITQLAQNPDEASGIDTNAVEDLLDGIVPEDSEEALAQEVDEAPLFTKDDIKILEQDYAGLGEEKAKEKRKEDFVEYISALFYVFSSNSPEPVTSGADINTIIDSFVKKTTTAFSMRSSAELDDLAITGEKMIEQMKGIEVPEELIETHIQMLIFAKYAQEMKDYINPNPADPIADIQNLTKISGLIANTAELFTQIETKFSEYGLITDLSLIDNKIKELEKNGAGS